MTAALARIPAAASVAIAPALDAHARPVRVLAAFPAAAYLAEEPQAPRARGDLQAPRARGDLQAPRARGDASPTGIVAIVAADGIAHPNALVLPRPASAGPLAGIRAGQRGHLGDGEVQLAGRRIAVVRWFDPVPRLPSVDAEVLVEQVARARTRLVAAAGELPSDLTRLVGPVAHNLEVGDADAAALAARPLVGRGPGLTPAGDDVLAGMLSAALLLAPAGAAGQRLVATARCAGERIVDHARDATTAISAALLAHAVRGEVAAPAAGVLRALVGREALMPALRRLLAVGATSGRDLAHGLLAGADLARQAATSPQSSLRSRTDLRSS